MKKMASSQAKAEPGRRFLGTTMMAAIRTILIADLVMSLDNVIAVAAAAKGSTTLLIIGLAISIPLVIFGSTLMIKLMERFPIIVVLGAALIGWVGGETMVSDVILKDAVASSPWLHYAAAAAGLVLTGGSARMEGAIAINALLARFPNLRLAIQPQDVRWRPSIAGFRGLIELPVALQNPAA